MSRFLLFGDILSLSEAKGTKTRFLGRRRSPLLLMYYTHVVKARASTNGRKSRDFKIASSSNAIEILSLSLSPSLRKEKQKHTTLSLSLSLSLFTFGVSLFRPKKVSFARNRERGFMICSRRFVSLFKKCFSRISGSWSFEKKEWQISMHLNTEIRVEKKRNISSEFNQLSHKNNNCEWMKKNRERFIVDTHCA